MPKSLSSYLPHNVVNWEAEFLTEQLIEHPLSRYVLATISHWSHADFTIMCLGTRFLKADFAIAYKMLLSLKAENARMSAIGAAAAECLNKEDHNLYLAAMSAVRPSKKLRHKFAHQILGQTSLIPDSLLLVDPKILGERIYKQSELLPQELRTGGLGWDIRAKDAMNGIKVYCKNELVKIAETAGQCEQIIHHLHRALGKDQGHAQSRAMLLGHPLVQPHFQRLSGQS